MNSTLKAHSARCAVVMITVVIMTTAAIRSLIPSVQAEDVVRSLTLSAPQEQEQTITPYIELIRQALAREGIKLNIVYLPGNRAFHDARAGIVDGELMRTEFLTHQYKELIPIKVNVGTVDYWVHVNAENACPTTKDELHKMTSVTLLGATVYAKIDELTIGKKHTINSPKAMLKVLHTKRADYFIAPDSAVELYAKGQGFSFKRCLNKPFISSKNYTFLNQRHAHLIPALERAYKEVFQHVNQ